MGTQNIALACLRANVPLVHISTNEVFSGDDPAGYEEWMPLSPRNPYGRSKAAAEVAVRALLSRYYIIRTAWLGAGAIERHRDRTAHRSRIRRAGHSAARTCSTNW